MPSPGVLRSVARGVTIAGLDIGTTKTCAVVATSTPDGLDIIGIGEAPCAGLRKGVIADLDETVHSIEAATERAERMSGVHISHVYVGVTGEHVRSTNSRGIVAIAGDEHEVMRGDVRRVVEASKLVDVGAERQILHALPRRFSVDGHDGVGDPLGLCGARLEVDTHIVTGSNSFIADVLTCVHRAGLEPAGLVFEPLASSAATLHAEERHLGAVLLDIGGGTTDIAVYAGGGVIHTSSVPVGGNTITSDIALGLGTTLAEAETIKCAHGSALVDPAPSPVREIAFRAVDGSTPCAISRAELRAIIVPRLREIFKLAEMQIAEMPRDVALAEVVLTGGGAHLHGIAQAAAEYFTLPARLGVPTAIGGLTDTVCRPQYATAVGLVLFGPGGDGAIWNRSRSTVFTRIASFWGDIWN